MEILEYGKDNNEIIILIHGFQTPYQILDKYIEHFSRRFHVLVPILPGHNPHKAEEFESFAECADIMEEYVSERYGNSVYAVYGMSMGGVLGAKLWQRGNLDVRKLILDGTPLLGYSRFTGNMLCSQYIYLTEKVKQRDEKTLNDAVHSIVTEDKLDDFLTMMDGMTENNVVAYIRQIGEYTFPDGASWGEIYYFHGTATNEMLAKKTAKHLKKKHKNASIICLEGKGHCQMSIFEPDEMIKQLNMIL